MARIATILTLIASTLAVPEVTVASDYDGRHKGCNTRSCDKRMDRKVQRHVRFLKWRVVVPYNAKLNRMAQCESDGRWHIATGNGFYGGLQFVPSTWWSVGGKGMPHLASILEQKFRAVLLIRREGYAPWPVCGYR